MSSQPSTEKQFYADAQAMFDELLRDAPTAATFLGDHRYDDQLSDYSKAAVEDQRRRLGQWQERFQAL